MKNLVFALTAFTVACGIPDDTPLTDIAEKGRWDQVCARAVDPDDTDVEYDCNDDGTPDVVLEASTEESCIAYGNTLTNPDCTATFGDWVDCVSEPDPTQEEICGGTWTPSAACMAVAGCVAGDDMDMDTDMDSDMDSDTGM